VPGITALADEVALELALGNDLALAGNCSHVVDVVARSKTARPRAPTHTSGSRIAVGPQSGAHLCQSLAVESGQRDFAAEYKARHPHGGDRKADQVVSTDHLICQDWCQSFGFSQDAVTRWSLLLDPAGYRKHLVTLDHCI
jgi:hypothetical protein